MQHTDGGESTAHPAERAKGKLLRRRLLVTAAGALGLFKAVLELSGVVVQLRRGEPGLQVSQQFGDRAHVVNVHIHASTPSAKGHVPTVETRRALHDSAVASESPPKDEQTAERPVLSQCGCPNAK